MKNINTITRTKEQIIEAIIEFFRENEEIFNDCIEELDGYNGYLGDDRYYAMDELDEFHHGTEPSEILRRAFYGYDEDTTHDDENGRTIYGEFNPNREYFRYNGYGNLVSSDYKDYSAQLDHYAVEAMQDARRDIYTIDDNDELAELFDELDAAEE